MGHNTSKFDFNGTYAKKSTKQLQKELKDFKDGLAKLDSSNAISKPYEFYNNHIAKLQLLIAERVGRK